MKRKENDDDNDEKYFEGEDTTATIEKKEEESDKISEGDQQPQKRRRKTGWDQATKVPIDQLKQSIPLPPLPTSSSLPVTIPATNTLATAIKGATAAATTAAEISAKIALQQQLLARTSLANFVPAPPKPGCRLYIGSIHYDLGEKEIIALFSAFGQVVKCELGREPTGRSRGFCFIEYADPASVDASLVMDGFEIGGRKVS